MQHDCCISESGRADVSVYGRVGPWMGGDCNSSFGLATGRFNSNATSSAANKYGRSLSWVAIALDRTREGDVSIGKRLRQTRVVAAATTRSKSLLRPSQSRDAVCS